MQNQVRNRFLPCLLSILCITPICISYADTPLDYYLITDLGELTFNAGAKAYGLNESGQVVGVSFGNGFLWEDGVMTDLGDFAWGGEVFAINDTGRWVGYYSPGIGNRQAVAADDDGNLVDLNTLLPAESGWELKEAIDINNNDFITGYGIIDGQTHAFLMYYPTGGILDLGTRTGSTGSRGIAINESKLVAGHEGWPGFGWLWQEGHAGLWDLSGPSGPWMHVGGINEYGTITGEMNIGWGHSHAFRLTPADTNFDDEPDTWYMDTDGDDRNDLLQDLGVIPFVSDQGIHNSYGHAINDDGWIAGDSTHEYGDGTATHAVLIRRYQNIDTVLDLNGKLLNNPVPGWILESAYDINNRGQIVGFGKRDGITRGFLLTPLRLVGDMNIDAGIDYVDFAEFSLWWQQTDCGDCGGRDLTRDGSVDMDDLGVLAEYWLMGAYAGA